MPLETAAFVTNLNAANPAHTDALSQADAHLRLIKSALQATFPGIAGPLTSVTGALVVTDGVAATPSHSFLSEPALGFYRSGLSTITFTGLVRGNGMVPAGMIMDFAGPMPPAGWLVCDGQAISRTTFVDLFAALSTTWGAGDGSTTFNVPNLTSRFRRHRDNSVLAGAVGATQNPANLSHTHGVSGNTNNASADHTHPVNIASGAMSANASHTHGLTLTGTPVLLNTGAGGASTFFGGGSAIATLAASLSIAATNTDHAHNVIGNTGTMSANHLHSIGLTSGIGSADDANEARPYSATVLSCIKT